MDLGNHLIILRSRRKQKEQANKESEEKKAAEEEKKALESYAEKPVADFMAKVQELGYTTEYVDDGVDFTEIISDMQADYSVDTVEVDTEKKTVIRGIDCKLRFADKTNNRKPGSKNSLHRLAG